MALTAKALLQRQTRKLLRTATLRFDTLEDRSTPAVTGLVFQDFNANGSFDTAGAVANSGVGSTPTAVDIGVAGVTVTAYDAANAVVGTTTTAANGTYTLDTGAAGPLRVEFTGLPAGVFFGPSGTSSNSAVQFVDAAAGNVNLSLVRPEDISVNDPKVVTNTYVFAGGTSRDANAGAGVIVEFSYSSGSASGDPNLDNYTRPTAHDLRVRQDNVGTTWGLAYDSSRGKLYAAAFMKRHSGFGPGGPGAIYTSGLTGSTATLYADLNSIYPNSPAGNLADVFRDQANNPVSFLRTYTDEDSWARDGLVRFTDVNGVTRDLGWDTVGKISLGGLDTNADNSRMYTVALGDRRLYSVPTSGLLNTSTVNRFDLPIPATVTGRTAANPLGDLRPFAVEYHRGLVYVGAVNSAEATQDRNDLKAYVFAFDPSRGVFVNAARQTTTTEAVLEIDLNYDRGHIHMGGEQNGNFPTGIAPPDPAEWNPWSPTIRFIAQQPEAIGRSDYPQPWLTGLSFDNQGNVVLGIRDRAGDQFGRLTAEDPLNPNAFNFFGMTAGDTLRAFINAPFNLDAVQANPLQPLAGWTLESNGRGPAGQGGAPQNTGQGPGGGEFYYQDDLPRDPTQRPVGVATEHDEVTVGGVLQVPGTNVLLSTAFDPVRIAGRVNTGGVRWFDNATGETTKQYELYFTPFAAGAGTFAKANGVGDLVAISGPPPVEIGNYVWNDANKNGVQDAGEQAAAGVQLTLFAAGGDGSLGTADDIALGTATTDATGNYYFSSVAGPTTASRVMGLNLTPNTKYELRLALGQSALNRKQATVAFATGSSIDSNAVTAGGNLVVSVTTGTAGEANHTFDIGLVDVPLVSVGNFVWNDANNNGVFDPTEVGIGGVTVNLYAANGTTLLGTRQTTAAGGYQFDDLAPGGYVLEIVPPAGFASSTGKNGSTTGPFEPGVVGNLDNQDHGTAQANGTIRAALVTLAAPGDAANPDTNGKGPNNANFAIDFGLFRPQAVGNFVWNDANNNGKLDGAEKGIGGVPVDLLDAAGGVIGSTTTDGNGNYLFTNLAPGTYTVRITAPAGFRSSTGTNGSGSGPYEPGVTGNQDNEDHGTTAGAFVSTAPFVLGAPGTNPDDTGFANLRQDFGLFRPLALGDFVWEDANNNGVFDTAELPLAGVAVALVDASGAVVATTATTGSGGYLFTNLTPGSYTVRVTPPAGYVSSTGTPNSATGPFEPAPQTDVNNSDHGTLGKNGFVQSVVALSPAGNPDDGGFANLRQDFGFFRPLAIGNFVWNDANNNGKHDAGEPGIPGVPVQLLDAAGNVLGNAGTDANGGYLFTGLTPGTFSVRITAPAGFRSSTGTNGRASGPYEPGVTGDQNNEDHGTAAGAFVTTAPFALLAPGANPDENGLANLRQDFGLFRPLSLGDFVWEDANNNGVFDTGELPLDGVAVALVDAGGATVATTSTVGGAYLFTNLIPGTYAVRVTTPAGYVSSTGTNGSPTGPFEPAPQTDANNTDHGTTAGGVAQSVVALSQSGNPDDGGFANLRQDFGFYRPLAVGNFVWNDANNDGKLDAGEAGLPGVAVQLLDAAGGVVGTTATDGNGNYLFTNLAPGTYTVRITAPAGFRTSTGANGRATGPYEPGVTGNQDNEDHGTAAGAFVQAAPVALLAAGANPDENGLANLRQDFGLFRPLAVGNLVWLDANNNGVFDPTEKGIAGIPVRLRDANLNLVAAATTDANGNYLFTDLSPGGYLVEIDRPQGLNPNLTSSTGAQAETGPYETVPGGLLPPNGNDNEDKGNTQPGGLVISARAITLFSFGANPDAGGAANLRQDFGLTTADRTVPPPPPVEPPPPPPPPVEPPPPPPPPLPAQVSGYVYRDTFQANGVRQLANGEAGISNTTVTLFSNGTAIASTRTDANGFYQFTNLAAGAYTIVETQPPAWIDGLDTVGSLGGTHPANDVLTVVLQPGDSGVEYNFGEVLPATIPPSPPPPVSPPPPGGPSKGNFLGSSPNGGTTSPPSASPPVVVGSRNPSFSRPINTALPTTVVTAGGAGSLPEVRVFDYSSGSERFRIQVYENSFLGGVRVATADVNDDGVDDVITGSGIGGGPRIRVFDGATGRVLFDFFAFESTFRGGVFVAGGDVNGDGFDDVVVGAEVGGGPRISTFSGKDGSVLNNFFAFDSKQRGGTRVAVADFNGDGLGDIVASTGKGVPTRIKVINGANVTNTLQEYAPYEARFTGGVTIAAGDVNGDGTPDVIAGAETGGGPRVVTFDGRTQQPILSYFAFESTFTGGIRVATQDVNADGRVDIVVGTGPGRPAETKIFSGNGLTVLDDFFPVDTNGGIYVG
jgi:protocatechuate 3,4-dioxygenase beta subunit